MIHMKVQCGLADPVQSLRRHLEHLTNAYGTEEAAPAG